MIKPFPITQARSQSEMTPRNDFAKNINNHIQRFSSEFLNEANIEIYNMGNKINELVAQGSNQINLSGKTAELLLDKQYQDVLAEFRAVGYKIKCSATGYYNSAAYEEGWEYSYFINVSW